MPIIKSAKKRVKQAEKRRERNYELRSKVKTHYKKVLVLAKEGKKAEAEKMMQLAYKLIDTADKKNILHKNNAARKKSRMAIAVAKSEEGKAVKAAVKAPKAKKTVKKKAPAKKEEKTEAKAENKEE